LGATGAQGLTQMGLDIWAAQLLGRWGSTAVQVYVREASVSASAAIARSGQVGCTLRSLLRDQRAEVDQESLEGNVTSLVQTAVDRLEPRLAERLLAPLRSTLIAELRSAAGRRAARAQSSSSDSSSSSDDPTSEPDAAAAAAAAAAAPHEPTDLVEPRELIIASNYSSVKHRVLVGATVTACQSAWVTACGWKFGEASGARDPTDTDRWCRRCFPERSQTGVDSASQR